MNFSQIKKPLSVLLLGGSLLFIGLPPARAASGSPLRIDVAIRHHRFESTVREVPKGQPLLFHVTNFGKSMEEFESYDMAFEVLVRPGQTVEIPVSGLGSGTYEYFGDFHPRTARGTITVK
ncbi:MAG: cupredoxin domain-containing protein [Nitrospirae bacterium]|nr:cupredoxin domain-containing protein [Nitrospirota bacterium]